MGKLSLKDEIEQEQERLKKWNQKPVRSDCGKYTLCNRADWSLSEIHDALGNPIRWAGWSNYSTESRVVCKVHLVNGDEVCFQWASRPGWLVRRWVMCFGPRLETICHNLRRRGVAIVDAYKPGWVAYNTLKLRGDRKVIDEVLEETGQTWSRTKKPGMW